MEFPKRLKCDLVTMGQVVGTLELLGYASKDIGGVQTPIAFVLLTVQSGFPNFSVPNSIINRLSAKSIEPKLVVGVTDPLVSIVVSLNAEWIDSATETIASWAKPEEELKWWAEHIVR